MFLQVIDGQVKLATHKINVTINAKNENLVTNLTPYQKEEFGLVAYSIEENDAIISILSDFNQTYDVVELIFSADVLEKVTENKAFNSRSEAIEYLEGKKPPTTESRMTAMEDAILVLIGGMPSV
jgi:hypothetical protein